MVDKLINEHLGKNIFTEKIISHCAQDNINVYTCCRAIFDRGNEESIQIDKIIRQNEK